MKSVPWWVWVSATPFGLGAWTPIVPGRMLRRSSWTAWGVLWAVLAAAGWVVASITDGSALSGALIILAWAGGFATALAIRPDYMRMMATGFSREREAAEHRLQVRREALKLVAEQPDLAEELGVGRPDRPGAVAAGLIDVNNAPIGALVQLPGVDAVLAQRIIELREQLNGFGSLADLGGVLDLDGNAVERLRGHAVFLPR